MKNLLLSSILLCMAIIVKGQSLDKIVTIEFTKQSRGFLDQLLVSRDSIHLLIENHRATEKSKHFAAPVDQQEWAELMLSLKDVSLKDVDGLQSPTKNRAHDGAYHSSIVISFENGMSITHGFDNEDPHPDLKPLLDAMMELKPAGGKP